MKKRTDAEKLEMVNEACELFTEAIEKFKEGEKLLHLCGVDVIRTLNINDGCYDCVGHDVQIYSGIKKLEKLTGTQCYSPTSYITGKPDTSRRKMNHHGILFVQVGRERTSTTSKRFTFR